MSWIHRIVDRGDGSMRNIEHMLDRLAIIRRLINESRDIADAEHEFMLGAKLEDCLLCTQERIASLRT